MNEINLYPEMNDKIADILRVGGEQPLLYAAALIEKLLHEKQERERGCDRCNDTYQLSDLQPHEWLVVDNVLYFYDSECGF